MSCQLALRKCDEELAKHLDYRVGGNWEYRISGGNKGRASLFCLYVMSSFRIWVVFLLPSSRCLPDIGLKILLGFPVRIPNSIFLLQSVHFTRHFSALERMN